MVSATTIYLVIYFLYIFSLVIDWQLIINSEYAIWGLILLMLAAIFTICILISLRTAGYEFFNITTGALVLILCGLLCILGIVLYYQYNMSNKIKTSIVAKIKRNGFIPLYYQYGRDSEEIKMRLGVNNIVMGIEQLSLQDMWKCLMSRSIKQVDIDTIMVPILGYDLNDNIDVAYDLLWYLCISEDPFRMGLSLKEIRYVIRANMEEINELIGDNYVGARDRASLIFTILSGQVIPDYTRGQRYEEIKQYHPSIVYNLSFIHNKIIDHTNGTYSPYGPYTYLAMQDRSPIEQIILSIEGEDYNNLIQRLGIGPINNIDAMSDDEKIMYLQGELSLYHNVFNRPVTTEVPPNIINMNRDTMMDIMSYYTNIELINTYEPRKKWDSRADLLGIICDDVLDGAIWSIYSVQNCNNDDSINVLSADRHGDMDKTDPEDPTVSYGIHKNYRCYQVSELEASFDDYDGVFLFRVPDWTDTSIDPMTNRPLIREFTLDSIKQLKILLEKERNNYNIDGLLNKINIGLELMKSATMQTRHLKQQLEEFTFEQKQIAELYLAWMFTYSMWMRFWKGPGTPWPLAKVNVIRESERNIAQRSSPEERDEHIFIQGGVLTYIIEMYEKDISLKDWIESLPTIYYDFETGEASCATHNIKDILDKIAIGDYCMGFGSDTILKTSYYYITSLLDCPQGHRFDQFIESILPRLNDLEYTVVNNQLNNVHSGTRYNVLHDRLNSITQIIPKQQPFNPITYQNNIHVD